MKLSIITINLNNAKGLEVTLKSIIEQIFAEYELIVIDGNSNDGSVEIIKKYSKYISYWVSEPDTSIYNAMNKGILKASGDYYYFLNSGDWLCDKSVLEKVLNCNNNESVLTGNVVMVKEKVVRVEKYPKISFNLFFTGTICHQASFMKKDLFFKYGLYDENLRIVADWKFFLIAIILNNESVAYRDINIAYHDLFGVSMTNETLFMQERSKILKELFPPIILNDYSINRHNINQINRLKSCKFTKLLLRICDGCLNRLERIKIKNENRKQTSYYKRKVAELY